MAPQDTVDRAGLAGRRSHRGRRWSSAGWSSRRLRRLRATGRGGDRAAVRRRPTATTRASTARLRIDQRFEPYPGVRFDDETYRGDAYPASAGPRAVAEVDVDLDTGEVTVRYVVSADDIGRVDPPGAGRGPGRGRHAPGRRLRHDRGDQARDGRYLNDRLATYMIPTALDAPRITAILVEAPFAGVPHGAKGVGELPMDVGAPAVVAAIHDATGVWIHDLPGDARSGSSRR